MTTHDLIYTALHNGLNVDKLLLATGLDRNTFAEYLDSNLWNHEQVKVIRQTIEEWELKKDLA